VFDYFGNQLDPSLYFARTGKYFFDTAGSGLTALQILLNQNITLRGQEMYFAIMRLMATSTGAFRASIYTSTSERYSYGTINATTDRVRGECLFGTAQRPAVLPVPIIIPGTSAIGIDLEDVSNATNALHLVFEGVRLFPKTS
jgi:hypothetical protein